MSTDVVGIDSANVTAWYEANVDGKMRTVGISPGRHERMATFIQVDKNTPHVHHDALQFADGGIVLLNHLDSGQEASVLTLPADPKTLEGKARAEAVVNQHRAVFV